MTTYVIIHLRIPGEVPTDDTLSYLERVEETVEPFRGRWLAMGHPDIQEGVWPGSVVLMAFPTRADAEEWYASPEYQKIMPLRTNSTVSDLIFVDDLPTDFSVAGFAKDARVQLAGAAG